MKVLICVPLLLLGIFFSGCKKEEITQQVVPNRTILADIGPSSWQLDNNTQSYYVAISMPEIDDRVQETNGILVSVAPEDPAGSGSYPSYEALPSVFNDISYSYTHEITNNGGVVYLWAQGVAGKQLSGPPAQMRAKIVIVESDPVE